MSGHEHVLLKLEMVTQSNNYQPQIGKNDKEWCFRWHIRCYKTLSQLTWFGQFVAFVFSHGNAKWADRGQSIMDVQINGLNPPQCWQCSLRRATTHPPYRDWMDQNRGRGGEKEKEKRESAVVKPVFAVELQQIWGWGDNGPHCTGWLNHRNYEFSPFTMHSDWKKKQKRKKEKLKQRKSGQQRIAYAFWICPTFLQHPDLLKISFWVLLSLLVKKKKKKKNISTEELLRCCSSTRTTIDWVL